MPARILTTILYIGLIGAFVAAVLWLRATPREIAEAPTPDAIAPTTTTVVPVPTTIPVTTTTIVASTTTSLVPRTTSKPTTTTTTVVVEPDDTPVVTSEVSLDDPDMDAWRAIALCEMPGPGGVPSEPWGAHWGFIGSRFSGAYGIANSTWRAFDGTEFGPTAGHATWQQQTIVARRIRDRHGYSAWGCGKTLGK